MTANQRDNETRCWLGHTWRSYECPACGELATGNVATEEHWRWYRTRTSSKRIKGLIDMRVSPPRCLFAGCENSSPCPDHEMSAAARIGTVCAQPQQQSQK